MISGICNTPQSKSITSPQNNVVPATIMHTIIENYSEVPIYTNYEGDEVDDGGDTVLTLGMMKIVLKMVLPTPRRCRC